MPSQKRSKPTKKPTKPSSSEQKTSAGPNKKVTTRQEKRPLYRRPLAILCIALIVLVLGYIMYDRIMIYRERQELKKLEVIMEDFYQEVVAAGYKVERYDKICLSQPGSNSFGLGPPSCGIALSFVVAPRNSNQAEKFVEEIVQKSREEQLISILYSGAKDSNTGFPLDSIGDLVYLTGGELQCGVDQYSFGQVVTFAAACFDKHSRTDHFPRVPGQWQ